MSVQSAIKRKTAPDIRARKNNEPIVMLTSYHAHTAALVDRYCDVILVGDSLGNVMHGYETTVPVTLEMMILQGRAVMRGSQHALVVVDMPFGSYEASKEQAFHSAVRILKETQCGAVKLEGGARMAETVAFLSERGVPVMGHIGLTPQSINTLGSFRAQGRDEASWEPILNDARAISEAGAFSVVIEAVAEPLARKITETIAIPTIGIGASAACDGQVLVLEDMLGLSPRTPKFVRRYGNLGPAIEAAIEGYATDVRSRAFPGPEHVYEEELEQGPKTGWRGSVMDWSRHSIPPMRLEARFGDRVVPAFAERPKSLWAMVAEAVARNPDGEALVCGARRMNWREVAERSASIAAGFSKLGLQRGDRIAVLLGNRTEFVLTMFAAAHAGLVTVLLSTRQQKPEIAYVLTDCGARLLIHEAALSDRLPDARDVPDLAFQIAVDDDPEISRFAELADQLPAAAPAEVGEEDTAMILYTSGTTGKPKGAMLAHCTIIHSSMVFVSCLKLTAADRSIAAVPLGHVTGVVANITTMLRCAGALIVMPEFKAAEYLKVAARERVTYTVMVPAMYNLCLLQPDFDSYDLSSWRIGGFGGAPMPIATIERLATKIPGLKLANCYGATETTSPSTMMPGELTASHIDSVGLPCPGAEIIAVSAEGHELPRGEIGELWIRSASVIRGYWNNPKATTESFTAGFWHSGDLGSVDADNFVRVFDRQKDMINRGGLKIYSAEVESVLAGHPDVIESAIIAKPCPVLGERVHAVVVTRNSVGDGVLRAWCAERLSDYKVPETMDVRSDPLPRNANGKVMKRQLREAAQV